MSEGVPESFIRSIVPFIVMCFGGFMALLDIQIVASSLQNIGGGLSAAQDEISWVQTAAEFCRRVRKSPVERGGGRRFSQPPLRDRWFADSPLEGDGFELVWGFSCQVVVFGFCRFFVRSWKAVLRPVACDQVRGARGRGQGTETVAKLGGLPPSVACVSQRLDA